MEVIEKIQEKIYHLELTTAKLEGEIKGKLDNIEKLLIPERGNRDNVITQSEQIKNINRDIDRIKEEQAEMIKSINMINLKIAMVS